MLKVKLLFHGNIAHKHGESIPKRPCPTKEDNINSQDNNSDDASLLYLDYNATTPHCGLE